MKVQRVDDVNDFLERTLALRANLPFETNLIGSVASSIAFSGKKYDESFWWIIQNAENEVIGAMMRTAPHNLVLSPMPTTAIPDCVKAIVEMDPQFPGISGPKELVAQFLRLYRQQLSIELKIKSSTGLLLYALAELVVPNLNGNLRLATTKDYDLALSWYRAFEVELDLQMHGVAENVSGTIDRGALYFWEVDGEIVSLVGHAAIVETPSGKVVRIGPVYTPPEYRGRGYASCATAAVSEILRGLPARVMLYTDATNPTSNGIYLRLGYKLIAENIEIEFK
jgi:predicted GNAT family acetyltransferase